MKQERVMGQAGRLNFRWNGSPVEAVEGDSVAAALYRQGIRELAGTRKRHLPLGYSGSFIAGTFGRVDGRPNVRLDLEPVMQDLEASAQNNWPGPRFDMLRAARLIPETWLRGGFEHPRALPGGTRRFQFWEGMLSHLAGMSQPPPRAEHAESVPGRAIEVDTLVVGGGPTGREAANRCACRGERVALACRSEDPGTFARAAGAALAPLDPRVEVVGGVEVFGIYRGGRLVAAAPHNHRRGGVVFRTERLVLATGRHSQPPLVPGAHLPGVMDAQTALRLAHDHRVSPGKTVAVVGTGAAGALAARLEALGTKVIHCGSVRSLRRVEGTNAVRRIHVGWPVACDALVHCGPWAADPGLVSQVRAKGLLHLKQAGLPPNVTMVGPAGLEDQAYMIGRDGLREALVCPCMDVTAGEILDLIASGETDPEIMKRATSCGMGPCQGVPCWSAMAGLIEAFASRAEPAGRPVYRAPRRAITVAQAAGLASLVEPNR
jgi:sarcosine oxidase subunit alpha